MRIRVGTTIDAPPDAVWADVRHIPSHVEWMADAVAIRIMSPATSGVGTTFECETKLGPIRLTDVMEVTEWREGASIGIRHAGAVAGTGRFTLASRPGGRTRFTWDERLRFPWWLGGPVGAVVGGQVLRLVWRRNLRALKRRIEGAAPRR